ncbi:MAG TPA: DUF5988 family protein [Streptomyces sp.]|uniref:DUF5988 family protein n=1 Tax=Streptomyces sp. TaxID=1931 RepID=UPI002D4B2A7E|nr:DUF5988 family protein [Streptomyces sp.]HZG04084.1 DUF5988 family protein [Streptomyces sp.]
MPTNEVNIILHGGPATQLPERERVRYLPDTASTFKMLSGNRYAHFEPTTEFVRLDDRELQVFSWTRYTYVAE